MTDQDRKDHELAAKAAGYVLTWNEGSCKGGAYCGAFIERGGEVVAWNPKGDDGDSRRLQVDCGMHIKSGNGSRRVTAWCFMFDVTEPFGLDKHEATRLAVFRCAVEIGRAKQ